MHGDELQLSNLLPFNNKFYKIELCGKVISIVLNKVSMRRTGTSIIISTCHIHYKYDKTNNMLENRNYKVVLSY